jgi:hypothetical protein
MLMVLIVDIGFTKVIIGFIFEANQLTLLPGRTQLRINVFLNLPLDIIMLRIGSVKGWGLVVIQGLGDLQLSHLILSEQPLTFPLDLLGLLLDLGVFDRDALIRLALGLSGGGRVDVIDEALMGAEVFYEGRDEDVLVILVDFRDSIAVLTTQGNQ